ncbi:hypothetical protein ACM55K_13385 [Flavobacterium sp. LT1R49]|uniref:hypothetical protein n=1 Tax=Flavobacterium arabinosi TaxID=3398737 RepID=UPI003A8C10AD
MKYRIILLSFLVCIGGIFYFSWLPDPTLETETYLPLWLRNWSNCYFNLRTAIPFLVLGFLLEARGSNTNRSLRINSDFTFRIINSAVAIVVVCVAEGGQFFILNRHPDFMDVVFGILGSLSGNLLYYLTNIFLQLFSTKDA